MIIAERGLSEELKQVQSGGGGDEREKIKSFRTVE